MRRDKGSEAKMARKTATYKELMQMAEDYGVSENALFLSAANNYQIQKKLIDRISETIEQDETIVAKEYVKDRENLQAHPLIKELPKHMDSANKSLAMMLNIVTQLGEKKTTGDKLSQFTDEQ
jgi:hypothetical protein